MMLSIRSAGKVSAFQQQIRCAANKTTYEAVKEKIGETVEKVGKAFESDGKIGKQFNDPERGAAAGAAEEVGGTFDERGAVGRQFKDDGAIGGRVEKVAEKVEHKGQQMKNEAKDNDFPNTPGARSA